VIANNSCFLYRWICDCGMNGYQLQAGNDELHTESVEQ